MPEGHTRVGGGLGGQAGAGPSKGKMISSKRLYLINRVTLHIPWTPWEALNL